MPTPTMALRSRRASMEDDDVLSDDGAAVKPAPEIDLSSPAFRADQFLAVTHATTSFASLQDELKELKRTTSDKTEQLKALVSSHFDQYLLCHEAVRTLAEDIRLHQQDNEQVVTDMKNLKQVTDTTLSVMLKRAKEQRRIRNTLAVLARFRPIFEITTKMQESRQRKHYEKLAEDYVRLKFHSTKSNISALQQVFAAAHEIALATNAELLAYFDDVSLSVTDQKRALSVLQSLGFVEKPTFTCLQKQFAFLEAQLAALQPTPSGGATQVVNECVAIIYRFRSGLWGFVCDLFKAPASAGANGPKDNNSTSMTSTDAQLVQDKAWHILSTCTQLIQQHATPTAAVLKTLNETFRQLQSLKKCPNAVALNENIAKLQEEFCGHFRWRIVLEFMTHETAACGQKLTAEYFDPVTVIAPSVDAGSTIDMLADEGNGAAAASMTAAPQVQSGAPKWKRLLQQATETFEQARNTSVITSESKIHLHRAQVLTCCANDVQRRWEALWMQVSPVLLEMAVGATETVEYQGSATTFREALVKAFRDQLHDMLRAFLQQMLDAFVQHITPTAAVDSTLAPSSSEVSRGVTAAVVFVLVSNCVELRERALPRVDDWFQALSDIKSKALNNSAQLRDVLITVEEQCLTVYVQAHQAPLQRMLRLADVEEAMYRTISNNQAAVASRSADSRTDSRTLSGALPLSPTSASIPSAPSVSASSVPIDARHYLFNVLLLLVTMRSEVDLCLGSSSCGSEYVHKISCQLTAVVAKFLEDAVAQLPSTADAQSEWRRIHLLVEVRFFLFGLPAHMTDNAKISLVALEKTLQQWKFSDKASAALVTLLAQIKHQTKLYLLCLQP
ncbi:TPA: hypothetical protein N0F65_005344 [Lagenidium giganteum]|uniref:Exocyst complex component n=1 Tax=Lagenidium giganteum TaxID=4803 RepID=A0AAV2YT87_9STRA|nr:TPA: hypothetical protein N0F65_005344 [Lagenidium giganteum]